MLRSSSVITSKTYGYVSMSIHVLAEEFGIHEEHINIIVMKSKILRSHTQYLLDEKTR